MNKFSKGIPFLLAAVMLLSVASFAAADDGADASVGVRGQVLGSRAHVLQDRMQAAAERAQQLRDRAEELGRKAMVRQEKIVNRTREQFAKVGERLDDLRQKRAEAFNRTKAKVDELQARLTEFRAKANLTDEEKAAFKAKVNDHVQASFDQRIELAQKLETDGANATLVADFVLFATGQKDLYANASTNSERRDLVVEFNHRWRDFRQAVAKGVVSERLEIAIDSASSVLARLDAVIVKLDEANFSTEQLVNLSGHVNASLVSASHAETLQDALFYLKEAHRGLAALKVGIQRAVNHELVQAFRLNERPKPVFDGLRVRIGHAEGD